MSISRSLFPFSLSIFCTLHNSLSFKFLPLFSSKSLFHKLSLFYQPSSLSLSPPFRTPDGGESAKKLYFFSKINLTRRRRRRRRRRRHHRRQNAPILDKKIRRLEFFLRTWSENKLGRFFPKKYFFMVRVDNLFLWSLITAGLVVGCDVVPLILQKMIN